MKTHRARYSVLHVLGHLILRSTLRGRYKYLPHCIDEETEARKVQLLSLGRLVLRLNKIKSTLPIVSVAKPLEVSEQESPSLSCSVE